MEGAEIPESWSQLATDIAVSKYFRRNGLGPNKDGAETSVRQLVVRLSKTIREAGEKFGGYFASKKDADAFEAELNFMLANQYGAFNSPVWFNVGTKSPQQVSACFILAVDDTMDSILNWYREEGLIFKGGSGAGLNLSRIRSSKELLSSGGTASGPVSSCGRFASTSPARQATCDAALICTSAMTSTPATTSTGMASTRTSWLRMT